jgi:hypothetical protein
VGREEKYKTSFGRWCSRVPSGDGDEAEVEERELVFEAYNRLNTLTTRFHNNWTPLSHSVVRNNKITNIELATVIPFYLFY